eukprot:CAMPEP_0172426022 /NCGR_PEP_ID=MMETSP1064-20121228/35391_1 /TAXON_ID=202472 /ORGANISM="Aulacoseira subarctica , Strain CCAP 1002/5" /LENGTH=806 /DNA_ID=CAMNT_0013169373 /DNA_START=36 /DNA_END=2453 /DNA_ORIENTATION=-
MPQERNFVQGRTMNNGVTNSSRIVAEGSKKGRPFRSTISSKDEKMKSRQKKQVVFMGGSRQKQRLNDLKSSNDGTCNNDIENCITEPIATDISSNPPENAPFDVFTNLQQAFASFTPLFCGATPSENRDDISTSNVSSVPSAHFLLNSALVDGNEDFAAALSNDSSNLSFESRTAVDDRGDNSIRNICSDQYSPEEENRAARGLLSTLPPTSFQMTDRVVNISIDKENGKRVENIMINMDSAHFCGWDGMRSHYTLGAIKPSIAKSTASDSTPIRGMHKANNNFGKNRTNQTAAADPHTYVDTSKLKLLVPFMHPLHENYSEERFKQVPSLKKAADTRLASQSPVIHLFQQDQHPGCQHKPSVDADSSGSFSSSSSGNSRQSSENNSQQNDIFSSFMTKLAFISTKNRKRHFKKKITNNGKMDDILDPRKLLMGEDEREIILGFLGSCSNSGSRSNTWDACDDYKKVSSIFPVETSLPTKSYIFEEGNGTVYLKAEDEASKRKFLSSSAAATILKKTIMSGETRFSRNPKVFAIKPGWRASAAKEIPRSAANQLPHAFPYQKRISSTKLDALVKPNYSALMAPSISSTSTFTAEQMAISAGYGGIHDKPCGQATGYYFSIFGGTTEGVVKNNADGNRDDQQPVASTEEDPLTPCLQKCIPTFDSLLRQRSTAVPHRGCLLEGWVTFLVGGDVTSKHWKDGKRECLRYAVIQENSHILFAYDSVDAFAASKSIDLSRGRVVEPFLISKELGCAVLIKSKATGKILCSLLPLHLNDIFFTDVGCWKVVDQQLFLKLWKSTFSKQKVKW